MDVLQAHGIAMTGFDRVLRQVGADEWRLATPCTEWSVLDLVNHLVAEQYWAPHLLAGATLDKVGDRFDGDLLGDEPVATWNDAAAAARAAWTAPDALDGTVATTAGQIDARQYGWEMTIDLAVHAWDLAQAIGVDQPVSDELATVLLDQAAPALDSWHSLGMLAAPEPVAGDADAVDRLVAHFGRDPRNPLPAS